jgi:nitrogen fixation-related uncharacterized protein
MVYIGTWLVIATVAITLFLFAIGVFWAYTHNQFDDVESAKYAMLDDDWEYQDDEI